MRKKACRGIYLELIHQAQEKQWENDCRFTAGEDVSWVASVAALFLFRKFRLLTRRRAREVRQTLAYLILT